MGEGRKVGKIIQGFSSVSTSGQWQNVTECYRLQGFKKGRLKKEKNPILQWSPTPIKQVTVRDQLTTYYITIERSELPQGVHSSGERYKNRYIVIL